MIFSVLAQMFEFSFLVNAFIVGALISLCAALLGVSLVLKRFAMIGDGLSHVGFGVMAVAMAANLAPLIISIPLVILAAFFLLQLNESSKIKGDSAIALISSTSLALGIIVMSLSAGSSIDTCNFMFGSILSVTKIESILSIILALIILALYFLFYNHIFCLTFDESFAKASGIKTSLFNMILAALTAIMIVLGMKMMGTLLISSLIVFPCLTSTHVCKTFKSLVISSGVISVFCFITGMIVSYLFETPTGATIVSLNALLFFIFYIISIIKKSIFKKVF
ncbi:MAG: metal ABC transporter permease [Treponemataceae bacterium]